MRNFKRFLLGLGSLVVFIALLYAEENIRGKWAWKQFKAQWEARGEKFDFAAFVPAPIPDAENFAMTPVVSTTYAEVLDRDGRQISPPNTNVVNRLQMPIEGGNTGPTNGIGNWQKAIRSDLAAWQHYYRVLALSTNLFPVPPEPQSAAKDVLVALSRYDSTIEELRQAAALPASRFPLNYGREEPYAILLPHLARMKSCSMVLRLRAIAGLEAGQSELALADIHLALILTEKFRTEPFLISHLVRIAMLHITTQAIWEGLVHHRWTEPQLAELERGLAAFDFVTDYRISMQGENACLVASVDFLRHHRDKLGNLDFLNFGEDGGRLPEVSLHLVPSGWFYQNELIGSKFILGELLPIGDPAQQIIAPELMKKADESLSTMRVSPFNVVCKMFIPGLVKSARRFASAQTTVNLARTACALERYRLADNRYPETLEALAPRFIDKVPHDLIGGQTLHYRLTTDGQFVLYSVGWNEKDDGGTIALTKGGSVELEEGDWVWRYPDMTKL
jgi:tetratricopeptide (TPR) repeat protein